MAASNEWTEWHLTPGGWVRGSEMVDINNLTQVDPPPGRILTVRYAERSSWGANFEKTTKELWRGSDASAVERLLAQHGEAPKQL